MMKTLIKGAIILSSLSSIAIATPVNLALTGTASQSSTYYFDYQASTPTDAAIAARAINGDASATDATTSHTNLEFQPWWQVDLGSMSDISKIAVWNRQNCCQERLADFTVSVLDESSSVVWSSFFSGPASYYEEFDLSSLSVFGQTVKIQLSGTNYLHLAEVQIFGNAQMSSVPLPAAIWLFGSGLLGVFSIHKKRRISQ